jgi:hypothetical protein
MKFGYEEILMVVIAFLIGWFLKTMMTSRLIEGGHTDFPSRDGGEWKWPPCNSDNPILAEDENKIACNMKVRKEGQECQNPDWMLSPHQLEKIPCEAGTECDPYNVPYRLWTSGTPGAWSDSNSFVGTCQKK